MRTWQATTAKETASHTVGWLPDVVNCPDDEAALIERLEPCENFLLMDDGLVVGWMALQKGESWTVVGFVIRPEYRGKWASKAALKKLGDAVFTNERALVLFDSKVEGILKLALRLGAKPIYDSGVNGQYALTGDNFKRSLHA